MNTKTFTPKPIYRSVLRKRLGRLYYQTKRYLKWAREAEKYARKRDEKELAVTVVEHKSVLLRPLKGVEMEFQHNKVQNLQLAVKKLNGVVIAPGQLFSLWYLVGKPTRAKGYLPGLVLDSGKIGYGIGGGLCQLGNLIYWMVLHTDLKVVERYRHGYDVFPDVNRKIPFGAGATLAYNHVDLMLNNPTNQAYQLKLWFSESHLHGAILATDMPARTYEVQERHHAFTQEWWGGYVRHNEIWRIWSDGSGNCGEELVTQNHAIMMYNPLLPA